MRKQRPDDEADLERFADLLNWPDSVSLVLAVVVVLVLIAWWPR